MQGVHRTKYATEYKTNFALNPPKEIRSWRWKFLWKVTIVFCILVSYTALSHLLSDVGNTAHLHGKPRRLLISRHVYYETNEYLIEDSGEPSEERNSSAESESNYSNISTYRIDLADQKNEFSYIALPKIENISSHITVLVLSDPASFKTRNIIRQTWANSRLSTGLRDNSVNVFFLLGSRPNKILMNAILLEAANTNDMIVSTAPDTYPNLIYKTLTGMHWFTNFTSSKLMLKVDEDVMVFMDRLTAIKDSEAVKQNEKMIYCSIWRNLKPVRNQTSKWYVSKQQYKFKQYPNFCSGPAYLLTRSAVSAILNITTAHVFMQVEDVVLTGILAEKAKVELIDMPRIFVKYKKSHKSICTHPNFFNVITIHGYKSTKLLDAYHYFQPKNCQILKYQRMTNVTSKS